MMMRPITFEFYVPESIDEKPIALFEGKFPFMLEDEKRFKISEIEDLAFNGNTQPELSDKLVNLLAIHKNMIDSRFQAEPTWSPIEINFMCYNDHITMYSGKGSSGFNSSHYNHLEIKV